MLKLEAGATSTTLRELEAQCRGERREGHVLFVLVAQLDLTHAMASLAALIKYLEVCPCA